jgi:hypothetical protein
MIPRSQQFDLGLDKERMKDTRDAARQEATVDALLARLFHPQPDHRWELQILADEVGMGKTFVGLGVAYSVLEAMQGDAVPDALRGCYQKVLIVTPTNSALFAKWLREVGEFVKRCVKAEFRDQAGRWFSAVPVERIDELTAELRRPGAAPRVIIASTSIFGGGKLRHYDEKRRHLLRALFRHWGTRFKGDERTRLLKGAPSHWPNSPESLDALSDVEWTRIMFSQDEIIVGLRQLDAAGGCVEKLLESCRAIAAPFVRNRDELFATVEKQLVDVYRELMGHLVNRSLPLVLIDEAHNWKNGPLQGSNGYEGFVNLIGKRARRAILLTATPFQLRPAEILEILKVGDSLKTSPTETESTERRERLVRHRETVIRPTLNSATYTSARFTKAWSQLPGGVTTEAINVAWNDSALIEARSKLQAVAEQRGVVPTEKVEHIIDAALTDLDPGIRQLLREGLRLFVYNADLSHELGDMVIRHRRSTGHRLFRVGMEYQPNTMAVKSRPDRHVLHAAPGVDVRGDGELPHYLLMRCVSEMKGGKGRSSLGSALTGCYSTLIASAEGRSVQKQLAETDVGQVYLNLLMRLVDDTQDPRHPKVREVVEATLNNWKSGEKTLIFCFRTNTAERLHEIIDHRIRAELNSRRDRCMGGPESLRSLRTRLTGRDRDLIVLGLDRVLWSVLWSDELIGLCRRQIILDDLELMDHELAQLAEAGLLYGIDLLAERVDRVFLHRATECLVARRLIRDVKPQGKLKQILSQMGDEEWMRGPYGLSSETDEDLGGAETAQFDERGVHSVYSEIAEIDPETVTRVAHELQERRTRARRQGQTAVLDAYERGPSLWLGANPRQTWIDCKDNTGIGKTIREMHKQLFGLLMNGDDLDWQSRRLAMQAVRRAVLRESVLLRLLPDKQDRDETGWGELLAQSFFDSLPGQRESMADRIAVFLEDLRAASGSLIDDDKGSARFALLDATRLRDQQFVALVSGNTKSRERVFSGFNTPLLPEVLICTSVGQEGIDLHRHCRHVVHFDLAWNPAVLEQRTGRVDRIGSKTFRERALSTGQADYCLEIGVPYLAGTYDERMYEEIRLRAQTFEVLTGGDLAADEAEGFDDHEQAEGQEAGLRFVHLPVGMVEAMRVKLHVWTENRTPDISEARP